MTRTDVDWTNRDMVADYLTATALLLAGRVREQAPRDVHAWLRAKVPANEWIALAIVLAALIPTDRPTSDLLRWIRLSALAAS